MSGYRTIKDLLFSILSSVPDPQAIVRWALLCTIDIFYADAGSMDNCSANQEFDNSHPTTTAPALALLLVLCSGHCLRALKRAITLVPATSAKYLTLVLDAAFLRMYHNLLHMYIALDNLLLPTITSRSTTALQQVIIVLLIVISTYNVPNLATALPGLAESLVPFGIFSAQAKMAGVSKWKFAVCHLIRWPVMVQPLLEYILACEALTHWNDMELSAVLRRVARSADGNGLVGDSTIWFNQTCPELFDDSATWAAQEVMGSLAMIRWLSGLLTSLMGWFLRDITGLKPMMHIISLVLFRPEAAGSIDPLAANTAIKRLAFLLPLRQNMFYMQVMRPVVEHGGNEIQTTQQAAEWWFQICTEIRKVARVGPNRFYTPMLADALAAFASGGYFNRGCVVQLQHRALTTCNLADLATLINTFVMASPDFVTIMALLGIQAGSNIPWATGSVITHEIGWKLELHLLEDRVQEGAAADIAAVAKEIGQLEDELRAHVSQREALKKASSQEVEVQREAPNNRLGRKEAARQELEEKELQEKLTAKAYIALEQAELEEEMGVQMGLKQAVLKIAQLPFFQQAAERVTLVGMGLSRMLQVAQGSRLSILLGQPVPEEGNEDEEEHNEENDNETNKEDCGCEWDFVKLLPKGLSAVVWSPSPSLLAGPSTSQNTVIYVPGNSRIEVVRSQEFSVASHDQSDPGGNSPDLNNKPDPNPDSLMPDVDEDRDDNQNDDLPTAYRMGSADASDGGSLFDYEAPFLGSHQLGWGQNNCLNSRNPFKLLLSQETSDTDLLTPASAPRFGHQFTSKTPKPQTPAWNSS
ncbi:hypothetical protein B0H13DRAFT_2365576 [Mycena leptocephala]|nr:hypothetical protein B0H13DRAFT_2365576 [Mycena leptocephala]